MSANPSYQDKITKEDREFTFSDIEIIITFFPEDIESVATTIDGLKANNEITVLNVNPEIGFARLSTIHKPFSEVLDKLKGFNDILGAMPACIEKNMLCYCLPDRFTLQFNDKDLLDDKDFIQQKGLEVISYGSPIPGYYTCKVPQGKDIFEVIKDYNKEDKIRFASPEECYFGGECWEPSDNAYNNGTQWALKSAISVKEKDAWNRIAGGINYGLTLAQIESTWGNVGGPNTIAAVIDSGTRSTHGSFSGQLLTGKNILDGSTNVTDNDGHGTAVMGNTIAVSSSSLSVNNAVGCAPKGKAMAIKFVNTYAGGWLFSNLRKAIYYVGGSVSNPDFPAGGLSVLNPGNRYVVCISVSYTSSNSEVRDAIIQATNNNVVVVCAAGNNSANFNVTPYYPANHPEVIAVGATTSTDTKWSISNYCNTPDATHNAVIGSPGVQIYTTSSASDSAHASVDGTSMSASIVTGILLQMWRRDYKRNGGGTGFTRTVAQMKTYIRNAANTPAIAGFTGRINAYNALGQVSN